VCENRVTRLYTVVIGTAFATDALRATVNSIKYLQAEFRFQEAGAGNSNPDGHNNALTYVVIEISSTRKVYAARVVRIVNLGRFTGLVT